MTIPDRIFKAYDIRGLYPEELDEDAAERRDLVPSAREEPVEEVGDSPGDERGDGPEAAACCTAEHDERDDHQRHDPCDVDEERKRGVEPAEHTDRLA